MDKLSLLESSLKNMTDPGKNKNKLMTLESVIQKPSEKKVVII